MRSIAMDVPDWAAAMRLPSPAEQAAYKTNNCPPYIVCRPDFGSLQKYTEYTVDFRADHLPNATYLSIGSFGLGSDRLSRQYASVRTDLGVGAYCGFQVLHRGTHVAIFSIWDLYCLDRRGRTAALIQARRVYPERKPDTSLWPEFRPGAALAWGDEGHFAQCIVPYAWQAGRIYRASLRILSGAAGGNSCIVFSVCDLENDAWTRLCAFDLGYDGAYMYGICAFLEGYLPAYAGMLRSMTLSRFRAHGIRAGGWTEADSASFAQNWNHPGSYSYGATRDGFFAITTGIPGRCALPPDDARFRLK